MAASATSLEGFVNVPIGDSAAIRLVGWDKHDAGYVDNKLGTRTFPTWDADPAATARSTTPMPSPRTTTTTSTPPVPAWR